MKAKWGRSNGRALKFFVSSNLSHCSAAESKKFPRQPDQKGLIRRRLQSQLDCTFILPMGYRFTCRPSRSKEKQVHMGICLCNDRVCNFEENESKQRW